MTRKFRYAGTVSLTALLLVSSPLLLSQQSSLQTSFLAPAIIRALNTNVSSPGIVATIGETEHLPYLKEIAKETKPSPIAFQPTASDLLIQQAEERFRNGKKAFQDRDFDRARTEFDAAIDVML